jgi:uncharacterized Zn-finger protein
VCNKEFIRKSYMVRHHRIHTSSRPYGSDACIVKSVKSHTSGTKRLPLIAVFEITEYCT